MCEALGYQVQTLKRVRMLNITLDGLKTGEYREVDSGRETEIRRYFERKEE